MPKYTGMQSKEVRFLESFVMHCTCHTFCAQLTRANFRSPSAQSASCRWPAAFMHLTSCYEVAPGTSDCYLLFFMHNYKLLKCIYMPSFNHSEKSPKKLKKKKLKAICSVAVAGTFSCPLGGGRSMSQQACAGRQEDQLHKLSPNPKASLLYQKPLQSLYQFIVLITLYFFSSKNLNFHTA